MLVGKGQVIAYVRMSFEDQNMARQVEALRSYGIDKWFEEKVAGKSMDRPKLRAMLDYVREGDTVYVCEFSRLARNTQDLQKITGVLEEKKVKLVSLKENFDTTTPTGRLMLTMISAIAEFERSLILERQREGIEIAKQEGKYKGRRKILCSDFPNFDRLYQKYLCHEMSKTTIARELKVSRPVVYRMIREYEVEKKGLKAASQEEDC